MPKRQRFATRDELAELVRQYLVEHCDGAYAADTVTDDVLNALDHLGVPIEALVKITVTEPTPKVEFREPRRE